MDGQMYPKKRSSLGENHQEIINSSTTNDRADINISNNATKLINMHPLGKYKIQNKNNKRTYETDELPSSSTTTTTTNTHFKKWSFGTINIRSGKEKEEGAKIYAVVKEVNRAGLLFCCLQEVKYRNTGSKLIVLDTGESYEFHWCGKNGDGKRAWE